MISVPFEMEWVEFGTLIPRIPLPKKPQKERGLSDAGEYRDACGWISSLLWNVSNNKFLAISWNRPRRIKQCFLKQRNIVFECNIFTI